MSIKIEISLSLTQSIPLDVPDEQFVASTEAIAISHEIPGTNSVGSMLKTGMTLVATGDDLNLDGTSKREWLSITWDQSRWPNAKFAEPAFVVLAKKHAMIAAEKQYSWKEGADGYPNAVEVPVIIPPSPPVQPIPNPFPGFPGSQAPTQPMLSYMQIDALFKRIILGQ